MTFQICSDGFFFLYFSNKKSQHDSVNYKIAYYICMVWTWRGWAMQREILFVGRLRRGEKKEDLIGVLSRTVFVEEKKKDTSVAWPVCRAAEKHTEIWGSKPRLQSRSCKTFSKILWIPLDQLAVHNKYIESTLYLFMFL